MTGHIPHFLRRFAEALYGGRTAWLALWVFSVMSVADIPVSPVFGLSVTAQTLYVIVASAFKATLLFALGLVMRRVRTLWALYLVGIGLFAMLSVVNCLSFVIYGFGISRRLVMICMQTTPAEIKGFSSELFSNLGHLLLSWRTLSSMAAVAVLFLAVRRVGKAFFTGAVGLLTAAGLVSAVVFSFTYTSGRSAHSLFMRVYRYVEATVAELGEFERLRSGMADFPRPETVSSTHRARTVVVVIGESASRDHWSLYGYPLETTPFADSIRESLYVFADVIGSSTSTSGNMERILTFKPDDDTEGDGLRFPRVVDMFGHAGYKTFWLSNQERTGLVSNTSGILASNADVIEYVGSESSEDALLFKHDDALLPPFREALADTAAFKLVFVHLIGSHTDYSFRYPADAAVFSADDELALPMRPWLDRESAGVVAAYDNSIRFTDAVLREIVTDIEGLDEPAVMVYLSDHGENVYDRNMFRGRDRDFVRVPFIVFVNDAYRQSAPEMTAALETAVARPFSTAGLVHPLMTLSGTGYCDYDSTYDVLSEHYRIRPRYVDERIWDVSDK